MKIGSKEIGAFFKPFMIAKVAQIHDGSLGQAMAFIDIAADSGANAISEVGDQLIVTPHIAGFTQELLEKVELHVTELLLREISKNQHPLIKV